MPTPTLDRILRKLDRGFTDTDVKEAVKAAFVKGSKEIFSSGSSWQGRRWKGLSAPYKERKRGGKIGVSTGALRRSLTGGGGFVQRANKREFELGSRLEYAAAFNEERECLFADPDALTDAYAHGLFGRDG